MRFSLSCFRFVIKPADRLFLPVYKGAVLRGGLGWTLKNLVCVRKDRDCADCLISQRCSYFRIFETPVPVDAQMMRKYPFAPHPFVITPPLDTKREFDNSCELNFDLTLIGQAIDYLPYFVYVFDELGRRGLGKSETNFLWCALKTLPALTARAWFMTERARNSAIISIGWISINFKKCFPRSTPKNLPPWY
jgi:hypothetical protein